MILRINIQDAERIIDNINAQLEEEPDLPPSLKASIKELFTFMKPIFNYLTLNSKNSSKPPSTDHRSNNKKDSDKTNDNTKAKGGQKGHVGSTLKQVSEPDVIEFIPVDTASLPEGEYKEMGVETRQVFEIKTQIIVTEYRAQILQNEEGKRFVATFPKGVNARVQYGNSVKAHAVYLSQYQMLPYGRIEEYFTTQLGLPLSKGTIYNFNKQASENIKNSGALRFIIQQLLAEEAVHLDETGINISGKNHWLHSASTKKLTYFFSHAKRGKEAIDAAAFLPNYSGIIIHDHWKP